MEDFNNNYTPAPRGDHDTDRQQAAAGQQPMEGQQPYAQQHEEPRTPYQTPVQHPAWQPPQPEPYSSQYTGQYSAPPQPEPPRKKKSRGRGVVIGLCSVAAACLLFAGGAVLGHVVSGGSGEADGQTPAAGDLPSVQIAQKPVLDPDNYDVVNGLAGEEIYKKVSPSIVSVLSDSGSGSGVIMTANGYIITNNHVVEGSQQVGVLLSDGTQLDAKVVGTDEKTDLAVLKAEPEEQLTPAEFGNSDELQPGEYAYAIGSPGGVELANTITGGRISAINRDITIDDRVMTLIQTDASINPGNSGGALINKYGQVVGITSAKMSSSGFGTASYEGLGFAIPMNTAKDIVDQLIQYGYITGRPSIGITGYNMEQGVYVKSVDERAHAAQEGLQPGDIITKVNGKSITTMDEINEVKESLKAGDKMQLTVYRMSEGRTVELTITLTDSHDLEGDSPSEQQDQQGGQNYGGYYQNPYSWFFGW